MTSKSVKVFDQVRSKRTLLQFQGVKAVQVFLLLCRGEKEEHGKTQQSCTLQFNRRSGLLECHELVEIKVEGHGDQLDGKIKCEIDKISCFSDGEKEKSGRAKFEVKEGELKIHVNEEKQNVVKTENGNLFAEIVPGRQNNVKVTCDKDQGVPEVAVLQVFCSGVHT